MASSSCSDGGFVAGVMSGTSLDGLDIAVVAFGPAAPESGDVTVKKVVAAGTVPIPRAARGLFLQLLAKSSSSSGHSIAEVLAAVCEAHTVFSLSAAAAIREWLAEHQIAVASLRAVGWHGQTVWHRDPMAPLPAGSACAADGDRTRYGATLQLGDGEVLAHALGVPVVWNFRAADVAVGGSGAPLVPHFDRAVLAPLLFSSNTASGADPPPRAVALLNLGGISNFTLLLRRRGEDEPTSLIVARDAGPANVMSNEAIAVLLCAPEYVLPVGGSDGGTWRKPLRRACRSMGLEWGHGTSAADDAAGDAETFCDWDGSWSRRGHVCDATLRRWLAHPFFVQLGESRQRSTGREDFGQQFVIAELRAFIAARHSAQFDTVFSSAAPATATAVDELALAVAGTCADFVATTLQLAAAAVARALASELPAVVITGYSDDDNALDATSNLDVLCSGGGARNPELMRRIAEACCCSDITTSSSALRVRRVVPLSSAVQLPGLAEGELDDAKEALAFALLAYQRLRRVPSNEPAATGAQRQVSLGAISEP